ncbi:hypothetical protein PV721_23190 [Streptomyces sp. MB09-01]|uniref:hypothetical protein n=1 Tax=Streptomyces sp. MB09-01 TaxID=3028666 RepID=UPI0029AA3097|nr:hypothetical protein [Streptomyces sp. MB09-01]MDX3537225.1 hypothetical protein [Streptomyces sp. MB09-01]
MTEHRLVVYPPDERGWPKVRYDGAVLGTAYRVSDIVEFLREAGMDDPESFDLTDPALVDWREIGPESWAE